MKFLVFLVLPAALSAGQTRYARLGEFDGQVEVQLQAHDAWLPAERNLPLAEGAWLKTGPTGRVEVEFDDGGFWRLGPNSQGEISDYTRLSTGQKLTLLSLDHGVAFFSGQSGGSDSLMVVAPGTQLTVTRPARVRLEAGDTSSQVWVLSGSARISSPAADMELLQGQTTRVEPATPARFFLDRDTPLTELDRWSRERDTALAVPASALHVLERYGLADLDAAGEWIHTDEFGVVWKPKATEDWLPFQKGHWRWYSSLVP